LARGEAPFRPVLSIVGRVTPDDVDGLYCRVTNQRGESGEGAVLCDVGAVTAVDAVIVDALARLQLNARRDGRSIELLHASAALRDLLDFIGLSKAVPCVGGSGLEPRRQAEEREPASGVEEEGDSGDSIA
jgi:ABC-type transporter Mla MlaB component